MKQLLSVVFLLGFSLAAARADETVRAAQTRLKQSGYYRGDVSGRYDSETSAAVTRFQIRHGLAVSGRIDPETAKALGIEAAKIPKAEPSPVEGTWRRLRNGDLQFLTSVSSEKESPPQQPTEHPAAPPNPSSAPPPARTGPAESGFELEEGVERLRDYVAAFILAGLDPQVGKELEFFASDVDYFGEAKVSREKIRRDLERYDRRWPQRRFRLAGELEVQREPNGQVRVSFPLHYELHNGSERASGTVTKTLVLRKSGGNDLEIVAVNEREAR
jgi:hypothetical protein